MENTFYRERLKSVRKILEPNHLDGILFISLENIRYLCGFTGSDGALVLTQKESFFLTDSRYWTQAEEEVKGSKILHSQKKPRMRRRVQLPSGAGRNRSKYRAGRPRGWPQSRQRTLRESRF
jgi:Xaa-Pro aminopeptidase